MAKALLGQSDEKLNESSTTGHEVTRCFTASERKGERVRDDDEKASLEGT